MLSMYRGPIEELTGRNWPNTPPDKRLIKASQRIEYKEKGGILWAKAKLKNASKQEAQDASILARWYNAQDKRMRAMLDSRSIETGSSDDTFNMLFDMAEGCETRKEIGLAAMRETDPQEGMGAISEGMMLTTVNFDSVPRNQEWTGISHTWTDFKGTDVMVFESRLVPGQPGIVIGMPPVNIRDAYTEMADPEGFPPGPAETVRDILKWHGAENVHWASSKSHGREREGAHLEQRCIWAKWRQEMEGWQFAHLKDHTITDETGGWIVPEIHHFWQLESAEDTTHIARYAMVMARAALSMREEAAEQQNREAAQGAELAAVNMTERAEKALQSGRAIATVDPWVSQPTKETISELERDAHELRKDVRKIRTNEKRGRHRWYADMCHHLLRQNMFTPIGTQFLINHDRKNATPDAVLQVQGRIAHQMGTWPSEDIYDAGDWQEGHEPDPELAELIRECDSEAKIILAQIVARCNERMGTETSPLISIFPELENRLRNTLLPLTGCITAFEYAEMDPETDPGSYTPNIKFVDEEMNPLENPQPPYRGPIGWTGYIWHGKRRFKSVTEAYPKDMTPQGAEQHLFHIKKTFADMIPDDDTGPPDPMMMPYAEMFFAMEDAIQHGIHTLNREDIGIIDNVMQDQGLEPEARSRLFREMTLNQKGLLTYLTYNSDREAIRAEPTTETVALSPEATRKITDAAKLRGVPASITSRIQSLAQTG